MAKKQNKTRRLLIYFLLLIIVIIVVAIYFRNQRAPKGEEVQTDEVTSRTIEEKVSASGRVYPETEVIISSDVSGEIVDLLVDEGDSVYTGQVLVRIDPEAYISTVERGRANLDNAKAQLAMSKAQIETGIARKEELVAQFKQAERVYTRSKKLFEDGIISEMEYDESLSQYETTQASLLSAEADIRSSQESAKAAEYTVRSQEASLKEMITNLNRTTIKAPNSGIISSLSVEQGERVVGTAQMTGTEIMRIADLSTMEVRVEVSENDIIKVALSDRALIEVDAYIDRKFEGIVTEIANSAANIAGQTTQAALNTDQVTNFIVKIRVDPKSYEDLSDSVNKYPFRPGMSASVDVITDIKEDVISVPIQSVSMRAPEGKTSDEDAYEEVVFLYDGDTARMVTVNTGIQDDEYIHVMTGLSGGEEVVTGPYSTLSKVLKSGTLLRKDEEKENGDD